MQAYQGSYAGNQHFKIREHLRSESLHCFRGSFLKNTLWGSYLETGCFSVLCFSIFLTLKKFPWVASAFWSDFQTAAVGLAESSGQPFSWGSPVCCVGRGWGCPRVLSQAC